MNWNEFTLESEGRRNKARVDLAVAECDAAVAWGNADLETWLEAKARINRLAIESMDERTREFLESLNAA